GDFAGLDALKVAIREDLLADAERTADAKVREEVIRLVAEANQVPAPPTLVARVLAAFAQNYGVPQEQFEAFAGSFQPVAEAQVRRELVLGAVVTAQNLRASEEEIDARVAEMAAARGMET